MIQVVDLFSCVGAHSLGLHRASPLFETVFFSETRPFRKSILAKNFPGVYIHGDVQTIDPEGVSLDWTQPVIVVGGPPCQATSSISAVTGSRSGSSLAPELIRIGHRLEADWIIVEQPIGHAVWEIRTSESLARHGYHVGRVEFGASDLGAPYQRRRVFILACAERRGLEIAVRTVPDAVRQVAARASARCSWSTDILRTLRVAREFTARVDGTGKRSRDPEAGTRRDRIESIGDSNPPEMMEVIGIAIAAAYSGVHDQAQETSK